MIIFYSSRQEKYPMKGDILDRIVKFPEKVKPQPTNVPSSWKESLIKDA